MTQSYAIYRLPCDDHCTLMVQSSGQPLTFLSAAELNGKQGFVVAPFTPSTNEPVVLIVPDRVERMKIRPISSWPHTPLSGLHEDEHKKYTANFANFHTHIANGEFGKVVLARCSEQTTGEAVGPEELFERACSLYPRLFIALMSTPVCGTWLMATPEILLEGGGNHWRTISLAGTMRYAPDIEWSEKNKAEQRYVSDYLSCQLRLFSRDVKETGPYTARAAGLVHLRSDFDFTLEDNSHLGEVIEKLYPTPAVCGIPKEKARRFIMANESFARSYYSGFCGSLFPEGESHLFVSLRCMRIDGNHYSLYAGGGLIKDSVAEQEWEETQAKMETMKALF